LDQGRNRSFTLIVRMKLLGTVVNRFRSAILKMKKCFCPMISMVMTLGDQLR
jgi:hypothetical protein